MSPERIRNESYSYPADIWSLGLALLECGTGEFPYTANEGPVNLMLQVRVDASSCYLFHFVWQKNATRLGSILLILLHTRISVCK
jgi:serine/threonine protein kinase